MINETSDKKPHLCEADWERVDESASPEEYAAYLERMESSEIISMHRGNFFKMLPLRAGCHILDAGCGIGSHSRPLARLIGEGGKVTGIDKSSVMIAAAKKIEADTGSAELIYEQGDICALPFADGSFDGLICDRVFIHLEKPQVAMAEFERVLKPNGWVGLAEPDWSSYAILPDSPTAQFLIKSHAEGFQNGAFGRVAREYLERAGLHVLHDIRKTRDNADLALTWNMMNLERGTNRLIAEGLLLENDVMALKEELQRAEQEGTLAMTTNMHYCLAQKKGSA